MVTQQLWKVYRYWIVLNGFEWSYVGCTSLSLDKRAGNKNTGCLYLECLKFGDAIRKYGWSNFQREILEDGLSEEEAFEKEQLYIQKFDSVTHGFNTSTGGKGSAGTHPVHSEKTRKKISASMKGKHNRPLKPVLQYDKQGNLLVEYPSIHEASKQTGIHRSSIIECCKGRLKSAGNSFWKYKDD